MNPGNLCITENEVATKSILFLAGLKKLREAKNISQAELARRIGISVRTIARYENGSSFPRMPLLGLKLLREEKNMSKSELGCRVGVSARTISRYENGANLTSEWTLEDLCQILDCDLWQIFHPDPIGAKEALCAERLA
jgi:transcriptional regulator with XRE-family HTH domain